MKRWVVADRRISEKCEEGLSRLGYGVIKVPPFVGLAPAVASHPDMVFFIGRGALVCDYEYYAGHADTVESVLEKGKLRLLFSREALFGKYPRDVLFNAAPIGNRLICRKMSVSETVRGLYPEDALINVNQGYAKCATLTVGDSGIITADPSVAKAVAGAGLDVLKLESHGVELLGYDCGFIGGASGDDGEHILFCGDLSRHPEGELIADFCRRHRREPVSLSDEGLYDYGTLLFL